MQEIEFILYVADQDRSTAFYAHVLADNPRLHVPGMTEFTLQPGVILGIMPEKGIAKIIGDTLPHPAEGNGIPRCELYLKVQDIHAYMDRSREAGAHLVSRIAVRDWGDTVGYVADPDGHVIAFAQARS